MPAIDREQLIARFIYIRRSRAPWKEKDRQTKTGALVEMNSGISVVIPAWRLRALLDNQDLVAVRKDDEEMLKSRLEKQRAKIEQRVAKPEQS